MFKLVTLPSSGLCGVQITTPNNNKRTLTSGGILVTQSYQERYIALKHLSALGCMKCYGPEHHRLSQSCLLFAKKLRSTVLCTTKPLLGLEAGTLPARHCPIQIKIHSIQSKSVDTWDVEVNMLRTLIWEHVRRSARH
jgi:hypothetical protein